MAAKSLLSRRCGKSLRSFDAGKGYRRPLIASDARAADLLHDRTQPVQSTVHVLSFVLSPSNVSLELFCAISATFI
jgi:hypothetical protein